MFLWAVLEPHKLSPRVRGLLEDRDTGITLSAATAWEIATRHRLGKLPGAVAVVEDYARAVTGLGARELSVSRAHALLAGRLPQPHRDPFDRLLVAQAEIEGLVLASHDAALRQLGVELLW